MEYFSIKFKMQIWDLVLARTKPQTSETDFKCWSFKSNNNDIIAIKKDAFKVDSDPRSQSVPTETLGLYVPRFTNSECLGSDFEGLNAKCEILCCRSGKDAMLLMQSLNKLDSPEQKLEATIKKHAELVSGFTRTASQIRLILRFTSER